MKKTNPLPLLLASLLLALLTTPAWAVDLYWSPSGTIAQTGGTWDTTSTSWEIDAYATPGTQTWQQGANAFFTVSAAYNVTCVAGVTVRNITIQRSAGNFTFNAGGGSGTGIMFTNASCTFNSGAGIVFQTSYGFRSPSGAVVTKSGSGTVAGSGQPAFLGKWKLNNGWWSLGSQHANYFGTSTADDAVTLNGGGIRCSSGARTVVTTPITVSANGGSVQAGSGTVTVQLSTKISGSGALTLAVPTAGGSVILDNVTSQHSGTTVVANAGPKLAQNNAISTNTTLNVLVASGFNMNGFNATVGGFQQAGVDQPRGVYTLATSGGYLTGSGNLTVGWQTTISTPVLTGGSNPSNSGDPVTFSATASPNQTGAPTPIAAGTITFYDTGGLPISGAIAVDGSGQASFTTTGLSVGIHSITAKYDGSGTIYKDSAASGALSHEVQGAAPVDRTWTGLTLIDPLWSASGNWDTAVPANGDGVIFASDGSNNRTPDLDLDRTLRSLVFSSGASSYTLVSSPSYNKTLTLSGSITNNATNPQTIAFPLLLSPGSTINAAAGNLAISGPISGTSLTKTGNGTLTLTNANTYTGGTTVSAGTLAVHTDGALGSGDVTVATGATLKLENGVANAYINPAGNLILQTGSPVVDLNFTGTNVINKLSLDGGATFQVPGSWGSLASAADHKDSRLTGSGILLVQTRIWLGDLDDFWSTAGNWVGGVVPAAGGGLAVELNSPIRTTSFMDNSYVLHSLKFDSGLPALTLSASGTLRVTNAAAGIINASANDQEITANIVQGASPLVVDTGSNNRQITLSGDIGVAGGDSTGGYTVNGNGTLYLNNTANDISGPTVVNSGATLRLADYSDLGANDGVQTLTLNGGTLRVDGPGTNPDFLYFFTACSLGAAGGIFYLPNAGELVRGRASANNKAISGNGKLTITGDGTLVFSNSVSGGNTYKGGTLIANARLVVKLPNNLGTNDVTVASGSILELTANNQFPSTAKLILQSGTPNVTLSYSGTTTIKALSFDGGSTWAAAGVWGSAASGAPNTSDRFSGTGTVTVPNPATPVSTMSITAGPGSDYTLSYSGGTGSKFILVRSTNVAAPLGSWVGVATNTASPGSFTFSVGTDPKAFYRIISE